MTSPLAIPVAIVAGGIVIAAAVYFSAPSSGTPALVRPVGAADHIFGNPAARVMLVEYADFNCASCRQFHDTLHQIVANANGRVAWVLREFPSSPDDPNARAAECAASAAGNDAFWRFADALFANQPAESARFGELASSAGIESAFADCYASAPSAVRARVEADRENARAMGAKEAPYSVILVSGKVFAIIDQAYPYDAVKALIGQALGE